jgi:superkiller protein 3
VLVVALLVAIGGIGWAVGDRAAHRAEAERVASDRRARVHARVQELMAAADAQMALQSWSEALATVRRADAVATSGEADPATAQKARELLQDLEFVERLDSIRSEQATWLGSGSSSTAAVREYEEAFRDHGIDIEGSSVGSTIARLGTTPALAIPLAAGLDDLARQQLEATRRSAASERFVLVANAIDPDPLRTKIRSACNILDTDELQRLAQSIDVQRQHPATVVNLARALFPVQPATAIRALRDAQRAHPGDFWIAFELGHALLSEKDFDGALLYYTASVAIRPDSAAAHSNLGYVLINQPQHDVEAAYASFRRALELEPSLAMGHVNMCRALLDRHQPDEALASIRKALALDPSGVMAWVGLGTVLLQTQQLEEAGSAFQRAIELDAKSVAAHSGASDVLRARGQLPEAISSARQAIAADPQAVGGYISLGNALAVSGESAAAAEAFRKAIELEPKNAVARGNLANILSSSREPAKRAEAIAQARKSVELDPSYAIGYHSLGNALLQDDQDDAALVAWRRAVELAPTFDSAHFMIGQILLKQRKTDEAMDAFQRVVTLRPKHAEAWYGIACVHIARNEQNEAEVALRKVVENRPENANAYHTLAVVLRAQSKHDEALAAHRRAAEIEPGVATRHLAVASNLYELRRFDEAAAACRKAIELDPRYRSAYAMLGLILRLQDKFAEAIDPLEQAVQLDPREPSITGVLAMLLATCPDANLRNGPRAVELARKAVELEPGDASNSRALGVALYRTGEWKEALAALAVASNLDPDNNGFDSLFAAMAHHRLGDSIAARAAYDQGCEWIERTGSEDQDTQRARAEAASLLGI